MEHISLDQFEEYFDEIIARVVDDKVHYQITTKDGLSVVLVPFESYEILKETYNYSFNQLIDEFDGPYTQEGGSSSGVGALGWGPAAARSLAFCNKSAVVCLSSAEASLGKLLA